MNRTVRIYASAMDTMREHARASLPKECCGLLAGSEGVISHALPLANALDSERAFFADPAELIGALRGLRSRGLKHLGIYHSHPSSENVPSRRDVEMAFYPDCAHFIISPRAPFERQVRAFNIERGNVTELSIEAAIEAAAVAPSQQTAEKSPILSC